jgi:hypothetical protein
MRCTELTLIPTALGMAAPPNGSRAARGPAKVQGEYALGNSGVSGGMRVLSPRMPRDAFPAESLLPAPDGDLGLADPSHDLGDALAITRQQDDFGPSRHAPAANSRLAATASSAEVR